MSKVFIKLISRNKNNNKSPVFLSNINSMNLFFCVEMGFKSQNSYLYGLGLKSV